MPGLLDLCPVALDEANTFVERHHRHRAAFALGYRRVVTYVLKSESGRSVAAAGWRLVAETKGGTWNCPSRPRVDKHPLQGKLRFEAMRP